MIFKEFINKSFILYTLKFITVFCICYFGCLFIIGVSAPGGYYSPFIDHYLNCTKWLRISLLGTSKWVLSLFGFNTYIENEVKLRMMNGHAIHIGYSCLGFGVMSFWVAFVFVNSSTWIKKIKWIVGGLLVIWGINVTRLSLLLVAINRNWVTFFYINHHTLFNIAAYIAIFVMIYLFSKSEKKEEADTKASI